MAIQTHQQLYWDNCNIGFSIGSGGGGGSGGVIDIMGGFNDSYSNLQQRYQQEHPQFQRQRKNQDLSDHNADSQQSMASWSHSIAAHAEEQRQELDRFITLQNERLRLALLEQRRQQFGAILSRLQSQTMPILRQKDAEIAQANKRAAELEDFLRRLEVENMAWQSSAKQSEALIASLNNAIEEVNEKACVRAEDAESCCDENEDEKEEKEGEGEGEEEHNTGKDLVCRVCNLGMSCVLFLPCRHLCSCKACEPFLNSCPICRTPKMASIEALIF